MNLNKKQISDIKKQIFSQINALNNISEQQKAAMKNELNAKSDEEFIQFLIQNKMIKTSSPEQMPPEQQCIFCAISSNKIPSYKIAETSKAIAVLEINPFTKAHTIIIPKSHKKTEDLPEESLKLAKQVIKKIKAELPKENIESIELSTSELGGHSIINIIPVYKGRKPEKKQADKNELEKLQKLLKIKADEEESNNKKQKNKKSEVKKTDELPKAPSRIP